MAARQSRREKLQKTTINGNRNTLTEQGTAREHTSGTQTSQKSVETRVYRPFIVQKRSIVTTQCFEWFSPKTNIDTSGKYTEKQSLNNKAQTVAEGAYNKQKPIIVLRTKQIKHHTTYVFKSMYINSVL